MFHNVETKIIITFDCITAKYQRDISIVSLTKFLYKFFYKFRGHCLASSAFWRFEIFSLSSRMFSYACADRNFASLMWRQRINLFVSSKPEKWWWKQLLVKLQPVSLFKIEFVRYFFFEVPKIFYNFQRSFFWAVH